MENGWNMHLHAHLIHLTADVKERCERCLTELSAALSNETLKWIPNPDFSDEDQWNPEVFVKAFEDHIQKSMNPMVTVVELFSKNRHAHQKADQLNAQINEKLKKVHINIITAI
jgi:hypothetical protein